MADSGIKIIPLVDGFPSDPSIDVYESLPVGTPIALLLPGQPSDGELVYTVASTLMDNTGKSYSDASGDSFAIKGNKIVTTKPLDFETTNAIGLFFEIRVQGTAGGVALIGNSVDLFVFDVLETLKGTSKFDQLLGTLGMDKIVAGAGNDMLIGYAGNDILYGGKGQDILTGGDGADTFLFKSIKESTTKAPDMITDWHHVADDPIRDLIDLHAIDANTKISGNQTFDWIATKSFTGQAGELRYEKLKSDTYIYADVNGDKKADFAIHVDDTVKLYKGDFLF